MEQRLLLAAHSYLDAEPFLTGAQSSIIGSGTNQKAAGLSPDEVAEFFNRPNP
jgi:hypothetical protein